MLFLILIVLSLYYFQNCFIDVKAIKTTSSSVFSNYDNDEIYFDAATNIEEDLPYEFVSETVTSQNHNILEDKNDVLFKPSKLIFKDCSISMTRIEEFQIVNKLPEDIHVYSVSSENIQFHSLEFKSHVIYSNSDSTIQLAYLPILVEVIEVKLHISTSNGDYNYSIQANSIPNRYQLHPWLGIKFSSSTTNILEKPISIYNPHDESLLIEDIYTSDTFLTFKKIRTSSSTPNKGTDGSTTVVNPNSSKSQMIKNKITIKSNNQDNHDNNNISFEQSTYQTQLVVNNLNTLVDDSIDIVANKNINLSTTTSSSHSNLTLPAVSSSSSFIVHHNMNKLPAIGKDWIIPPGESKEIIVLSILTSLKPGIYRGIVHIKTNFENLMLPVELTTLGNLVYPLFEFIDFGVLSTRSESKFHNIYIVNSGQQNLTVLKIYLDNGSPDGNLDIKMHGNPVIYHGPNMPPNLIATMTYKGEITGEFSRSMFILTNNMDPTNAIIEIKYKSLVLPRGIGLKAQRDADTTFVLSSQNISIVSSSSSSSHIQHCHKQQQNAIGDNSIASLPVLHNDNNHTNNTANRQHYQDGIIKRQLLLTNYHPMSVSIIALRMHTCRDIFKVAYTVTTSTISTSNNFNSTSSTSQEHKFTINEAAASSDFEPFYLYLNESLVHKYSLRRRDYLPKICFLDVFTNITKYLLQLQIRSGGVNLEFTNVPIFEKFPTKLFNSNVKVQNSFSSSSPTRSSNMNADDCMTTVVNDDIYHLYMGDQSIFEPKQIQIVISNMNVNDVEYSITNASYPMCMCHDGHYFSRGQRAVKNLPDIGLDSSYSKMLLEKSYGRTWKDAETDHDYCDCITESIAVPHTKKSLYSQYNVRRTRDKVITSRYGSLLVGHSLLTLSLKDLGSSCLKTIDIPNFMKSKSLESFENYTHAQTKRGAASSIQDGMNSTVRFDITTASQRLQMHLHFTARKAKLVTSTSSRPRHSLIMGLTTSIPIILNTYSQFKQPVKDLSLSVEPRRFYYIQRGPELESVHSAISGIGFEVGLVHAINLSPWITNISTLNITSNNVPIITDYNNINSKAKSQLPNITESWITRVSIKHLCIETQEVLEGIHGEPMVIKDQSDFNFYSNSLVDGLPNYSRFMSGISFWKCSINLMRRLNYSKPNDIHLIDVLNNLTTDVIFNQQQLTPQYFNNLLSRVRDPENVYVSLLSIRELWHKTFPLEGMLLPEARVVMVTAETTHRYVMKDIKILSPLTYSPLNYSVYIPTAQIGKMMWFYVEVTNPYDLPVMYTLQDSGGGDNNNQHLKSNVVQSIQDIVKKNMVSLESLGPQYSSKMSRKSVDIISVYGCPGTLNGTVEAWHIPSVCDCTTEEGRSRTTSHTSNINNNKHLDKNDNVCEVNFNVVPNKHTSEIDSDRDHNKVTLIKTLSFIKKVYIHTSTKENVGIDKQLLQQFQSKTNNKKDDNQDIPFLLLSNKLFADTLTAVISPQSSTLLGPIFYIPHTKSNLSAIDKFYQETSNPLKYIKTRFYIYNNYTGIDQLNIYSSSGNPQLFVKDVTTKPTITNNNNTIIIHNNSLVPSSRQVVFAGKPFIVMTQTQRVAVHRLDQTFLVSLRNYGDTTAVIGDITTEQYNEDKLNYPNTNLNLLSLLFNYIISFFIHQKFQAHYPNVPFQIIDNDVRNIIIKGPTDCMYSVTYKLFTIYLLSNEQLLVTSDETILTIDDNNNNGDSLYEEEYQSNLQPHLQVEIIFEYQDSLKQLCYQNSNATYIEIIFHCLIRILMFICFIIIFIYILYLLFSNCYSQMFTKKKKQQVHERNKEMINKSIESNSTLSTSSKFILPQKYIKMLNSTNNNIKSNTSKSKILASNDHTTTNNNNTTVSGFDLRDVWIKGQQLDLKLIATTTSNTTAIQSTLVTVQNLLKYRTELKQQQNSPPMNNNLKNNNSNSIEEVILVDRENVLLNAIDIGVSAALKPKVVMEVAQKDAVGIVASTSISADNKDAISKHTNKEVRPKKDLEKNVINTSSNKETAKVVVQVVSKIDVTKNINLDKNQKKDVLFNNDTINVIIPNIEISVQDNNISMQEQQVENSDDSNIKESNNVTTSLPNNTDDNNNNNISVEIVLPPSHSIRYNIVTTGEDPLHTHLQPDHPIHITTQQSQQNTTTMFPEQTIKDNITATTLTTTATHDYSHTTEELRNQISKRVPSTQPVPPPGLSRLTQPPTPAIPPNMNQSNSATMTMLDTTTTSMKNIIMPLDNDNEGTDSPSYIYQGELLSDNVLYSSPVSDDLLFNNNNNSNISIFNSRNTDSISKSSTYKDDTDDLDLNLSEVFQAQQQNNEEEVDLDISITIIAAKTSSTTSTFSYLDELLATSNAAANELGTFSSSPYAYMSPYNNISKTNNNKQQQLDYMNSYECLNSNEWMPTNTSCAVRLDDYPAFDLFSEQLAITNHSNSIDNDGYDDDIDDNDDQYQQSSYRREYNEIDPIHPINRNYYNQPQQFVDRSNHYERRTGYHYDNYDKDDDEFRFNPSLAYGDPPILPNDNLEDFLYTSTTTTTSSNIKDRTAMLQDTGRNNEMYSHDKIMLRRGLVTSNSTRNQVPREIPFDYSNIQSYRNNLSQALVSSTNAMHEEQQQLHQQHQSSHYPQEQQQQQRRKFPSYEVTGSGSNSNIPSTTSISSNTTPVIRHSNESYYQSSSMIYTNTTPNHCNNNLPQQQRGYRNSNDVLISRYSTGTHQIPARYSVATNQIPTRYETPHSFPSGYNYEHSSTHQSIDSTSTPLNYSTTTNIKHHNHYNHINNNNQVRNHVDKNLRNWSDGSDNL